MVLSIIVPVFNEERHLEKLVRHFMAAPFPCEREWIFVNDASTDGTGAILEKLSREFGFRLLNSPINRGKGASVAAGIALTTGDMVLIQDADFEYDIFEIPRLLQPLLSGQCDVVFGSRFQKARTISFHTSVNLFLTYSSNLLSGLRLTDMETCYKIFRADLLKSMNLRSERFGIEVEMTAYVAKSGARILELPISYSPRTRAEGKKIGWRDGFAALGHLVKFNLFVSRKQAFHSARNPTAQKLPKASGH